MNDLIDNLIQLALAPLSKLVDGIRTTLGTLWAVVVGFFRTVRTAWINFRNAVVSFVGSLITHGLAILTTLRWVVTTLVPRMISIATNQIVSLIARQIAAVRDWATSIVADVRKWAGAGLALLSSALAGLQSWAIQQVRLIIANLNTLGTFVWGVLGTPEKLAAWAGEAILSWAMGYVRRNAQRFLGVIWNSRQALYAVFIHLLEDFLHTIL